MRILNEVQTRRTAPEMDARLTADKPPGAKIFKHHPAGLELARASLMWRNQRP